MKKRMAGARAITAALALPALLAGAAPASAQQAPRDLIVQSTTSVRDSGLLDQLITPGFQRAFPQYNLKFVAVGTGQAITNARSGQGDALIGHAPPLEQQFVNDGFSFEPVGRLFAWNDFVIVGPASDPAGVATKARHDAAGALAAIAAAGAAGRAHFVSRGDNSGTNTKELEIWRLTNVPHAPSGEPTEGAGNPSWYVKAGLGMADTLRLTQQCPFAGGGCYTITDRGTLSQLRRNGAITALPVRMDDQQAGAPGGKTLMINSYRVYAINPAKFPGVNLQGALAFADFLTSPDFQRRLASFPTRQAPGFFPAAFPRLTLGHALPRQVSAARRVTIRGGLASAVPGDPALRGLRVRLARFPTAATSITLARDTAGRRGRFVLRTRLTGSGQVFLTTPRFRTLSPLSRSLGRVRVRAAVGLRRPSVRGHRVVLRGRAFPSSGRRRAVLQVRARAAGTRRVRVVRQVRLRRRGSAYRVGVILPAGRWQLQTRYVDRGVVAAGVSARRSASVR